mgnify:CR=1 FL=1
MNTRRKLVIALGAGALAAPFGSFAQQQGKVWRVGFLNLAAPDSIGMPRLQAVRDGLHELGYIEGTNLQFDVRWAEGKFDRLPALVAELVALKVDVIVIASNVVASAALKVTKTLPIVMAVSGDPVGDGLAASLARPGGNITGLSSMAPELGAKASSYSKRCFQSYRARLRYCGIPLSPACEAGSTRRIRQHRNSVSACGRSNYVASMKSRARLRP